MDIFLCFTANVSEKKIQKVLGFSFFCCYDKVSTVTQLAEYIIMWLIMILSSFFFFFLLLSETFSFFFFFFFSGCGCCGEF